MKLKRRLGFALVAGDASAQEARAYRLGLYITGESTPGQRSELCAVLVGANKLHADQPLPACFLLPPASSLHRHTQGAGSR